MPITHAALRQMRKDRVRQTRNQAVRSELKTIAKRLLKLLSAKKAEEARAALNELGKRLDRAASRGVIHRNTAARTKSRLTKRLSKLSAK